MELIGNNRFEAILQSGIKLEFEEEYSTLYDIQNKGYNGYILSKFISSILIYKLPDFLL